MATLTLIDLIEKAGLPLNEVVVIRHSANDKIFNECKMIGREMMEYYQCFQVEKFFKNRKYLLSFVADCGTAARFLGCYEIGKTCPAAEAPKESAYPDKDVYSRADVLFYQMQPTDYLKDLKDRLVIDWGKSTLSYVQYTKEALEKKGVLAIYNANAFPGYDKVCWNFDEMVKYIKDPLKYSEICDALKAVNGIYLVLDTIDGKQYVGSAYGKEGIFQRWTTYANTKAKGGANEDDVNKALAAHLDKYPDRYLKLQYCILEVIHRTGNADKDKTIAEEHEKLWKQKLGTKSSPQGLNLN